MDRPTRRLRRRLESGELLLAPFVYDALQARLAEQAGFQCVYMTGFGTAAARGFPDLGLLTLTEMVANARSIARSVDVPVICDADTGYGGPLQVERCVREYEDAGAAGLHLEDQVWPKRCGFMEGKRVIPQEEMVGKVGAACAARRDADLVIIARTDALAPHGWAEAERRARAYREAGADLVFVDGLRTPQDARSCSERLGDLPLVFNAVELGLDQAAHPGFRLALHAGTLLAAFRRTGDAMTELARKGRVDGPEGEAPGRLLSELSELLGASERLERARRHEESD